MPSQYWSGMGAAADEFEGAPAHAQAPTVPLARIDSLQDRCVRCGAALASDQRYCVECGQRLGRARLPLMDSSRQERTSSARGPAPRRWRASPSTALIAGVGTLLLAMGVGVLIGRSGQSKAQSNPPIQVSIPGGASAGTPTPGASTESPTTGASSATPAAKSAKATASKSAAATAAAKGATVAKAKAAAKASAPAKKVAPPPPTKVVTVGQPGKGAGYEKGHFTGNFFGKGEE